jgi:hypothetical protein
MEKQFDKDQLWKAFLAGSYYAISKNRAATPADRDNLERLTIPAETPHEKARRLWEEWEHEPDGGITYEAALQIVPPLFAEIDRLKSETWTEDDLWWAVNKARQIIRDAEGKWYPEEVTLFKDALASRRAAKAKE